MTYVLGAASVTNAPLRLQFTCAGDGWDSLGRAYGVPALDIIKMQPHFSPTGARTPINNKTVQAFIKALPGWSRDTDIFPFVSSNNPGTLGPDGKPEGFAHFGANTQLMLPDMPRLDGKKPGPKPTVPVTLPEVSEASIGPIALGFLGLTALVLFWPKKKKQGSGGKPSPKPVTF